MHGNAICLLRERAANRTRFIAVNGTMGAPLSEIGVAVIMPGTTTSSTLSGDVIYGGSMHISPGQIYAPEAVTSHSRTDEGTRVEMNGNETRGPSYCNPLVNQSLPPEEVRFSSEFRFNLS